MRILAVHSAYHPDQKKRSAVDAWRLARPLAELRKHCPDWVIDERMTVIPDIAKYKDKTEFTEAEMEAAFKDITSYDVVISSYQSNPTIYTLLKVAAARAGTQYIMDIDDDMFAINPDNPVWMAVKDENVYHMQCMIRDNTWISTTTPELAQVFRERRQGHASKTVFVNPNYINHEYQHPKFDNGDKLVIGFVGGSSHYADLHKSGALDAIARIMHEHKNVYFKSVGMVIDTYLPKARFIQGEAKKGDAFLQEIFPNLNYDISIGPILDNIFNRGKSNIKWQESTRAGALFVGSNVGPYALLPADVGLFCQNTEDDWYRVLKRAVEDVELRKKIVKNAQLLLDSSYQLKDNIENYKQMFETVVNSSKIGDKRQKEVSQTSV